MLDETVDPATPAPDAPQTAPDGAAPSPAPEPQATPDTAPATTDGAPDPQAAPKPKPADRRFANMTAKLAAEAQRAERAEAELAAARALLETRTDGGDTPAPTRPAPMQNVEEAARQLVAEREFNKRLGEIDTAGKDEIGHEVWSAAKETLTSLGAIKNQAFLAALAETEHPAQIFAALAEDTDALLELLDKQPAAMAARLGRMDAKIAQPKAPVVSKAPPPAPRVGGTQVVAEPDPYNYQAGMSMREWNAMMDKHLPPHLGGKRKSA